MLREGVRKGALSLFIPVAKDAFRRTIGWGSIGKVVFFDN
jgi:hypothetical protein